MKPSQKNKIKDSKKTITNIKKWKKASITGS